MALYVPPLIEDLSFVHSALMYNFARLQFRVALRRRWQVGVGPFVFVSVFCASVCFVGFVLPVACGLVQNAPPTDVTVIANLHENK